MKAPKNIFYDYNKMWSYDAMINFVVAERGVGKTYGAIKNAIRDFINNEHQFVYMRRTLVELDESFKKLIGPILQNDEFPDHAFKYEGNTLYIDDLPAGYGLALSTSKNLKSASYEKVRTLIYDEFIADGPFSHYLRREVHSFLDVIETIGRLRDIRVLLLGNAVTISNPYFDYFNLNLPYNSDFKLYKDGLILVHYAKNLAYQDYKSKTKFGRLIADTEYGNYSMKNEFLLDDKHFIEKKPDGCKNWSVVIFDGQKYGVWINYKSDMVYISKDYDPNHPCVVACSVQDHTESTLLMLGKTNQWIRPIVRAFRNGLLRFENQKIKNNSMRIIQKMI